MPKAILSTTAPFGFEIDSLRFLEAFRAVGCTSCQFFRNQAAPPDPHHALTVVERAGLRFDSVHGVFGPGFDPSSPDADHRQHCLRIYEEEGRLALELGGAVVVVHPSKSTPPKVTPTLLPLDEARRLQHERWPHLHDFLSRLADVAERLGVTYVVENLMLDCPLGHDPVELAERILRVCSPRIRMCFDTGHAHATLSARSPAPRSAVATALRVCAPAIGYLHIHDNDGVADTHRMPGRGGPGGIDWNAFADALRHTECPAIRMLEVFEDPSGAEPGASMADLLSQQLALK